MTDKLFVDRNILIYAYDLDAGAKYEQAAELICSLWLNEGGVLSTQVLQELYVNVTQKISKPVPLGVARGILDAYQAWQVEVNTIATVLRASEYQERNRLSFWDAMIVVAAVQGGAGVLLTEDLNAGQIIEGVEVRNPFGN